VVGCLWLLLRVIGSLILGGILCLIFVICLMFLSVWFEWFLSVKRVVVVIFVRIFCRWICCGVRLIWFVVCG